MLKTECRLWGENLSPNLLREIPGIHIRRANEVGEISKTGRYRDKSTPYGVCSIVVPDSVTGNTIEWLADFVAAHKAKFEVAGATSMSFWICWYGIQGNMELSARELSKLAALQIPLCMDYIFEG